MAQQQTSAILILYIATIIANEELLDEVSLGEERELQRSQPSKQIINGRGREI